MDWLGQARERGEPVKPGPRFQELRLGPSLASPRALTLEVVLPNGLVVRGASAATVAELVRALQESPRC